MDQQEHEDFQDASLLTLTIARECLTEQLRVTFVVLDARGPTPAGQTLGLERASGILI